MSDRHHRHHHHHHHHHRKTASDTPSSEDDSNIPMIVDTSVPPPPIKRGRLSPPPLPPPLLGINTSAVHTSPADTKEAASPVKAKIVEATKPPVTVPIVLKRKTQTTTLMMDKKIKVSVLTQERLQGITHARSAAMPFPKSVDKKPSASLPMGPIPSVEKRHRSPTPNFEKTFKSPTSDEKKPPQGSGSTEKKPAPPHVERRKFTTSPTVDRRQPAVASEKKFRSPVHLEKRVPSPSLSIEKLSKSPPMLPNVENRQLSPVHLEKRQKTPTSIEKANKSPLSEKQSNSPMPELRLGIEKLQQATPEKPVPPLMLEKPPKSPKPKQAHSPVPGYHDDLSDDEPEMGLDIKPPQASVPPFRKDKSSRKKEKRDREKRERVREAERRLERAVLREAERGRALDRGRDGERSIARDTDRARNAEHSASYESERSRDRGPAREADRFHDGERLAVRELDRIRGTERGLGRDRERARDLEPVGAREPVRQREPDRPSVREDSRDSDRSRDVMVMSSIQVPGESEVKRRKDREHRRERRVERDDERRIPVQPSQPSGDAGSSRSRESYRSEGTDRGERRGHPEGGRRPRVQPPPLSSPNNEPMMKERDSDWLRDPETQKRRERLINAERERERQRETQRRETEARRGTQNLPKSTSQGFEDEDAGSPSDEIRKISERLDKKKEERRKRDEDDERREDEITVVSRTAVAQEKSDGSSKFRLKLNKESLDDLLQDVLELQVSEDEEENDEEEEGALPDDSDDDESRRGSSKTSTAGEKSPSVSSSSESEDSEDSSEEEEDTEEEEEEEDEDNDIERHAKEEMARKTEKKPDFEETSEVTAKLKIKIEDPSPPPSKNDDPKPSLQLEVSSEEAKYSQDSPLPSPAELKPELPPYYPAIQGCRQVEEFDCLNRIEEGTYGVVYRARDKRTSQIVALKRLKMEKEKEGFPITSLREINTLLKAQHPNIVTVREIVVGANIDKIYIVMDYVEHDLKTLMETMKQPFLVGEVKTLMMQLLNAVAHLHDNWILHRDLKTSNLLLSHKGILKVGDFGLAREYGSPLKPYTEIVVTLWYRAPELLLGIKQYSTPIDLWSVGCIFAELLNMKPLFPGKSEADQLNRIFKDLGTPNERIWPGYSELHLVKKMSFIEHPYNMLRQRFGPQLTDCGFDLLNKFLTYNPTRRVTAEDAKKHDYFKYGAREAPGFPVGSKLWLDCVSRESPLPVEPSMFPTWPAKSELGHVRQTHSPKAPSGGKQYNKLANDDEDIEMSNAGGFHMTTEVSAAKSMGFSLKF